MSEEWTEWREHDGKACPVEEGLFVHAVCDDLREKRGFNGVPFGADGWGGKSWCVSNWPAYATIIRYRIRKPKALEQLRQIARDVEAPLVDTPKEPVRA